MSLGLLGLGTARLGELGTVVAGEDGLGVERSCMECCGRQGELGSGGFWLVMFWFGRYGELSCVMLGAGKASPVALSRGKAGMARYVTAW